MRRRPTQVRRPSLSWLADVVHRKSKIASHFITARLQRIRYISNRHSACHPARRVLGRQSTFVDDLADTSCSRLSPYRGGRRSMNAPVKAPFLMLTELFLPTKGGTAVSFDDDFRRLGGKEIHVVTADVPGASDFDRVHPNAVHRLALRRVRWLRPESLLICAKLFAKTATVSITRRFVAIFAGRVLPEGLIAWAVARLLGRPVLIYAHGEELTNWGRGRKFALMCSVFRRADA